jgi:hypothetical protein
MVSGRGSVDGTNHSSLAVIASSLRAVEPDWLAVRDSDCEGASKG